MVETKLPELGPQPLALAIAGLQEQVPDYPTLLSLLLSFGVAYHRETRNAASLLRANSITCSNDSRDLAK